MSTPFDDLFPALSAAQRKYELNDRDFEQLILAALGGINAGITGLSGNTALLTDIKSGILDLNALTSAEAAILDAIATIVGGPTPFGQNFIGRVGSLSKAIILHPNVTVAAYAIGTCVGGKLVLTDAVRTNGDTAVLQEIHILDRSNQKPALEILIFNADLTVATAADFAAFVYGADDLIQVTKVLVSAADYTTINAKASASLSNLGKLVKSAATTNLWAVVVASSAYTPAAITDFQIIFKFLQD